MTVLSLTRRNEFLVAAALSLSTALLFSTAQAAGPVAPRSDQMLGVDQFVLLVDGSSSINTWASYDQQKQVVENFAAGMPEGSYQVSTLVFGGGDRDATPLSSFDRRSIASAAGTDALGKGTPLADVIGEAQETLAGATGNIAVVIFTDGLPTSGGRNTSTAPTLTAARRLIADHPDRICIHTVQTGDAGAGKSMLSTIAGLTDCGSYRTLSQLQSTSALASFQNEIFFTAAPPAVSAPPPNLHAVADFDGDGVPDAADICAGTPSGVRVDSRGCAAVQSVRFGVNSATLADDYQPEMNLIAATLAQNDDVNLRIVGHASSEGPAEVNRVVSEARARAVKNRIVAGGIDPNRIEVRAQSDAAPIAPNDSQDGRVANRRVDLEFVHN